MIEVRRTRDGDPMEFDVVVSEATSQSRHHVTMARHALPGLTPDYTPEALIGAAFRFLLDREPKESILARFDVSVIARYFPEFEIELPEYLQ